MRRTQDLAIARLRLLSTRRRGRFEAAPTYAATLADAADHAGPDAAGEPGGSGGPPGVSRPDAAGEPGGGGDAWAAPPASATRTTPAAWAGLLAALVAVVLLVGGVAVARSWPRGEGGPEAGPEAARAGHAGQSAPASPSPPVAGNPSPPAAGDARALEDPFRTPQDPPAPTLVVHVAGEVRRPGVVTLPVGSRVGDAVAAAGGLRRGADAGAVNLARPLVDGERVEVGPAASGAPTAPIPAPAGPPGTTSGPGKAVAAPVDLNTATAEQLDALPGIGPVTASKILAWRATNGRFTAVDELAEVPGIGPRTLEELRPHVRV